MQKMEKGAGYDDLNAIRDQVLSLPVGHKLRIRYRDLRRALANQVEDIRATGTTGSDIPGVERSIRELRRIVEA